MATMVQNYRCVIRSMVNGRRDYGRIDHSPAQHHPADHRDLVPPCVGTFLVVEPDQRAGGDQGWDDGHCAGVVLAVDGRPASPSPGSMLLPSPVAEADYANFRRQVERFLASLEG
jgi:hypothetical protein